MSRVWPLRRKPSSSIRRIRSPAENLLSDYVALGRMAEAKKELERTQALGLNSSTDDLVSYMVTYFLLGEPQQVQRIMAQLAGRPDEFLATQALAATQQYAGQFRLAEATMRRAADQAARAKASDAQAGFLLEGATALGLAGLCESNEKAVQQAMSLDKSKQTQATAALTAAVCGNGKLALPLASGVEQEVSPGHADPGCLRTLVESVCGPGGRSCTGGSGCRRTCQAL